jgi:hypothetical protein
MIKPYNSIYSWLKFLDVEYLTDEKCNILCHLDINDSIDQDVIIKVTMEDDFKMMNDISRMSLKKILEELPSIPDERIFLVIDGVGMPFNGELTDFRRFFSKVYDYFFGPDIDQ